MAIFAPFEWTIATRYLRARRSSGFVSVIAGFSFLGIMLGVATLIVVMSVMNGFHKDLLNKILGINGHIFLQAADTRSPITTRWPSGRRRCRASISPSRWSKAPPSRRRPSPRTAAAFWFAASKRSTSGACRVIANNVRAGTLDGFDTAGGVAIGQRLAENLNLRVGDKIKIMTANGAQTPFGVAPRVKAYQGRRDLRDRHGRIRRHFRLYAAARGAGLLQSRQAGERRRTLSARPGEYRLVRGKIEQVDRSADHHDRLARAQYRPSSMRSMSSAT